MNNELIFLCAAAVLVFGFFAVNAASFLISKRHSQTVEGTVVSIKMPNSTAEKMRNSKWAVVTYKVAGKRYTSSKRIQVPMSAEVGSRVSVRCDAKQPEILYESSAGRVMVSAFIFVICAAAIVFRLAGIR